MAMRAGWLSSLGLALGVSAGSAVADEPVVWRAASGAEPRESLVTFGRPVPVADTPAVPVSWRSAQADGTAVVRAQGPDGLPPPAPPPGTAPLQVAPPPPGPPTLPPPGIPYNPPDLYNQGVVPDTPPPPPGTGWWDKTKSIFDLQTGPFCGCAGRRPFQSDHCFDGFIEPVSNPFFFEDPRALTELRPIFMYQSIPHKNYAFAGGSLEYFGVQGRVALTQSVSIVMSKLGGIWVQPGGGAIPPYAGDHSGFADIDIGPKWTFLRNERSGTLGAVGLWFEIPTGDKSIGESEGLSLYPFLTMGQNFGRSSYGSFNVLGEIGYSFGVDNKPSDFFATSLHLDYDIGNLHKIYPLLELNWRYYTENGKERVQTFEGGDLINFGATEISGRNNLTLAPGVRYKFNENAQFGTALEFPVVGTKDLLNFRWTIDFIWRY
jgi:hypothetical protein